jgi:hypothetical protein
MTPEERFTKIENFLLTVAEHQADHEARFREMERWRVRHDEELAEIRAVQSAVQTTLGIAITHVAEAQMGAANAQKRTEEALERLARSHERTEEVQRITEAKLNALIETVDRIIRKFGPDA